MVVGSVVGRWRCWSIDLVDWCGSVCREPGMPASEPPASRTVVDERGLCVGDALSFVEDDDPL
jgi:hypothetical protein